MISLLEMAMTVSCFCNVEIANYILSSEPFTNMDKNAIARLLSKDAYQYQNNVVQVQIPPPNLDISRFSDDRTVKCMTMFFQRYIEETSAVHFTAKLLLRHLEELLRCIIDDEDWPLATVEFLLSQVIDTQSAEFEACLVMANSHQQWTILKRLLDRELPESAISMLLEADFPSLTIKALEIILESAALSHINARSSSLVQRNFEFALRSNDYGKTLLFALSSPHRLRITPVLAEMTQSITHDSAIDWLPMTLSAVDSRQEELEVIWRSLPRPFHAEKDQWKIKALLKAGLTGSCVAETLVSNVRSGNHAIVALIIDYWHLSRDSSSRASFDFEKRILKPNHDITVSDSEETRASFCALGDALLSAVLNGDLPMCQLLLEAQAPLVSGEKTIIEAAIKAMDSDTLLAFIKMCAGLDDFGSAAVDFALLKAVSCALPGSAKAMVMAGGSVLAYDCECLKVATAAACSGEMEMLKTLVSLKPEENIFAFVARETIRILQAAVDEPQTLCEVFRLLREGGYQDVSHFNAMLITLCGMKSTQWDHVQVFLGCGASVESTGGACMAAAWRSGNLQLFPQLFSQCKEQDVLNDLFVMAVSDHTSGTPERSLTSSEDALVVLAPLLTTNIPSHSRSGALSKIACQSDPSIAILELMLQTGAPIIELEGRTLYRLSRLNDSSINSLITHNGPAITARLKALLLLFEAEDSPIISISNSWSLEDESNDLDHACLDLLIWPQSITDAFNITDSHTALFKTMLAPPTRPSCLKIIERFLQTPQGLSFLSAYCKWMGRSATEELLSTSIATLQEDDCDRRIGWVISALQVNAPRLLAGFEVQPADSEQFFDCISDLETHTAEDQKKSPSMYLPMTVDRTRFCLYDENEGFTYELQKGKDGYKEHQQLGLALPRKSLNRLLFDALELATQPALTTMLIDAGADPNAVDSEGRSALLVATSGGPSSATGLRLMGDLVSKGASADDGSLHLATCNQDHMAMELLLKAGHSIDHRSPMHQNSTVLEAFIKYDHAVKGVKSFIPTLKVLLNDTDPGATVWQARPSLVGIALETRLPFELLSALLNFRPKVGVKATLLRRGRYRYSLLSAIEKWGTDINLTISQRKKLVAQLTEMGFQKRFYASEGDQPSDAVGIPDRLLDPDSRDRLQAWKDKECSVCGERPKASSEIHAHLFAACIPKHGWKNEIICIDCLRQCLESKMFPEGDERHPAEKITCWAPRCGEILDHTIIQQYTEASRFSVYDDALCQRVLHAGQSMAKCAREACKGAIWLDPVADKNVTVFNCPICHHRTCTQCNQPYKKHENKACPAGEAAKANARRKEEEKLTKAFMKTERKCPKCKMLYQRRDGCDHITCGKDTHTTQKSCKFLPLCLDDSVHAFET